jgi:hypothetical protein
VTCPTCGHRAAFDVLSWLEGRCVRLAPAAAYGMRYLFEHAGELHRFGAWAEGAGVAPNTLRYWCAKYRLPAPGHWYAAARGLWIADAVRRNPARILTAVAPMVGLADHSGLVHHLRRTFDVTAKHVKDRPGDDWLMERWWSRHASPSKTRRAA